MTQFYRWGSTPYILQGNILVKANVGDTKTENGKTYKLNANHRWTLEGAEGQMDLFGLTAQEEDLTPSVLDDKLKVSSDEGKGMQSTQAASQGLASYFNKHFFVKEEDVHDKEATKEGLEAFRRGEDLKWHTIHNIDAQTWADFKQAYDKGELPSKMKALFEKESSLPSGDVSPQASVARAALKHADWEKFSNSMSSLIESGKIPNTDGLDITTQTLIEEIGEAFKSELDDFNEYGETPSTVNKFKKRLQEKGVDGIKSMVTHTLDYGLADDFAKELSRKLAEDIDFNVVAESVAKRLKLNAP